MRARRSRLLCATMVAGCALACASTVTAQSAIEVTPYAGYRFGGDFFELLTLRPIDTDGAPAIGLVVDIPVADNLQFEAAFTHQNATIPVPVIPLRSPARVQISVDHWQGGGLQEFGTGRIRPFLTGAVGLTRYATEGDAEVRLLVAAGGGVKVFPSPNFGVRLNGQVFATFVDAEAHVLACSIGICLARVHVDVVWQTEFTAGLVVRFR